MDKEIKSFMIIVMIVISAGMLLGLITIMEWVFKSHMEAKAYTQLTGKQVTTSQAMWLDLKIVEPPKP